MMADIFAKPCHLAVYNDRTQCVDVDRFDGEQWTRVASVAVMLDDGDDVYKALTCTQHSGPRGDIFVWWKNELIYHGRIE